MAEVNERLKPTEPKKCRKPPPHIRRIGHRSDFLILGQEKQMRTRMRSASSRSTDGKWAANFVSKIHWNVRSFVQSLF
jgi:hypothetical protein